MDLDERAYNLPPSCSEVPMNNNIATSTALESGTIEVLGRLPFSSNFTFLVEVAYSNTLQRAIYKPQQGEEPLWDFQSGIYTREVAAYRLANALGWPNIPTTIVRPDGPYGIGSLQQFVDADFEQHYFTLKDKTRYQYAFMAIATFDLIANNADRKSGHCLLLISNDPDGNKLVDPEEHDPSGTSQRGTDQPAAYDHATDKRWHGNASEYRTGSTSDDANSVIWAIDNSLSFHVEPKLRTVIWEFGGQPIPDHFLDDIERVANQDSSLLDEIAGGLLTRSEVAALRNRMRDLVEMPKFPEIVSQRQYPWPLV